MTPGLFVAGTGTEVGKTVVAATVARTLAAHGRQVRVFKPALSGLDALEPGQKPDHELLRAAAGSPQSDDEIAPYRYGPPVSPHLAAEMTGSEIDPARIVAAAHAAGESGDTLVCEGVGGILVPLTLGYLVRDFARDLGFPVLVAASPGLGTINHTLLTLEAIRAVGLQPRAVILTPWPDSPGPIEQSNRETIAALGDVEVLALERIEIGDPGSWPELEVW